MTVCLECRIVKFLCLFGTVAVRGKGRLESCVSVLCYCCVLSYVNSHSAILCLVSVCVCVCYLRLFGDVSYVLCLRGLLLINEPTGWASAVYTA